MEIHRLYDKRITALWVEADGCRSEFPYACKVHGARLVDEYGGRRAHERPGTGMLDVFAHVAPAVVAFRMLFVVAPIARVPLGIVASLDRGFTDGTSPCIAPLDRRAAVFAVHANDCSPGTKSGVESTLQRMLQSVVGIAGPRSIVESNAAVVHDRHMRWFQSGDTCCDELTDTGDRSGIQLRTGMHS